MNSYYGIKIAVTSLLSDKFPPKLNLFRNYVAPKTVLNELFLHAQEKGALSDDVLGVSCESSIHHSAESIEELDEWDVQQSAKLHRLAQKSPLMAHMVSVPTFSHPEKEAIRSRRSRSPRHGLSRSGAQSPPKLSSFPDANTDKYGQYVWQAARATGAAPTYFRACGAHLDGGLISNNPTMDILTEITETNMIHEILKKPKAEVAVVMSIGTGRIPVVEQDSIDIFRPYNPLEILRSARGITTLGRILVEMATMSEGRVVERSRAWCNSIGAPFFRFSPYLSSDVYLDANDTQLLLQVLWETETYIHRCRPRLARLALMLVASAPETVVD